MKDIQIKRWPREKEQLSKLDPKIYKYTELDDNHKLQVQVIDYTVGVLNFDVILGGRYPLEQPKIAIHMKVAINKDDMTSLIDFGEPSVNENMVFGYDPEKDNTIDESRNEIYIKPVEFYLAQPWTPIVTIDVMIKAVHLFLAKHVKPKENSPKNPIYDIFSSLTRHKFKNSSLFIVILIAFLFRVLCGFGNYSGYNDPPKYGDFEAQRHWLELTYHTPPSEWYIETQYNNFTYWKIDYPPLTAYHSWVLGYFMDKLDPKSIALFTSRGYESRRSKMLMRSTVLISDLLIFFSAVIYFCIHFLKKYNHQTNLIILLLILLAPPLILIDHGHFQYNCCMLGLTLWAINFCVMDRLFLGSILFTLAFNFKQMGLYYSIAFFAFILGRLYKLSGLKFPNPHVSKTIHWFAFIFSVGQIGAAVILTMVILWLPWISSLSEVLNVVRAIFPISRGLYQLKVASFWCVSDVIIKWQRWFSFDQLAFLSLALTLMFSIPSAIILTKFPNLKNFKISLFNISMAFFFFSYHVHEKTILVPLLPLLINIRFFRHFYIDFIMFSTMTCYDLLKEDKLELQFFTIIAFYYFFGSRLMRFLNGYWNNSAKSIIDEGYMVRNKLDLAIKLYVKLYTKYISKLLYFIFIMLMIIEPIILPPAKYPYLYELFYAILGFIQYFLVFGFSNLKLFSLAKKQLDLERDLMKNTRKKELIGKQEQLKQ